MFKKVQHGLNQRKVKVFSLFLLCSFLAWLISNLSDQYESNIKVSLGYGQLPDSLLLGREAEGQMEAKIRASGFQFLYYNFFRKHLEVDLSQVQHDTGGYYVDGRVLERQLDQQLAQRVTLISLDRDRLSVDLYQVASKEIPVEPNLSLGLQPNHMLEGEVLVEPAKIMVKGPARELDGLEVLETSFLELTNVAANFSRELPLLIPKGMENSSFSTTKVRVKGRVSKFSEKVYEVPVKVLNIPDGYQVETFPKTVKLVCKATVERLKEITTADFVVVADYAQLKTPGNSTLVLEIAQRPEDIYDVGLPEGRTINFVLKQL